MLNSLEDLMTVLLFCLETLKKLTVVIQKAESFYPLLYIVFLQVLMILCLYMLEYMHTMVFIVIVLTQYK